MAQGGGRKPFAAHFAAHFAQCFFLKKGYFFEWAERSKASQWVGQPTGAKQPATS